MDDIRRKLALIDKQLAGGPNFFEQIISTSPLALCAAGLIAGIVIQNIFDLPALIWLILLIVSAAATVLFFIIRKSYRQSLCSVEKSICHFDRSDAEHREVEKSIQTDSSTRLRLARNDVFNRAHSLWAVTYLALACFICLGAIRLSAFYRAKFDDVRNFIGDEPKLATIRGLIVSEPFIQDSKEWKFARFKHTDPKSSFYLKLREIETTDGWAQASGAIRVQVDEPILDLRAGDYVQMYCRLERFKGATNPGQFDVTKYLARKNVFVAASVNSREAIEVLDINSSNTFTKIKRYMRQSAVQMLGDGMDVESQNYALLQALVLGYRGKIDSETYQAFQKTGLLHFICLSGMNFGIVIGIIWWLSKTIGLMKPGRSIVCMISSFLFLLVVAPNPPAFRAAIMCFTFCASFFFCRKYNAYNSLSLAAVILLLIRPTYLFEADWQLSFACVLGILLFTKSIENYLNEKAENWFGENDSRSFSTIFRFTSIVIKAFSVSFAAYLACVGISLHHFYAIRYLKSIWTLVVAPLICVVSIIGYLKLLLSPILPSIVTVLDMIIEPLSSLLIWIVKLIASWNISEILLGKVSPAVIIFYYTFLFFAFFVRLPKPFLKKQICTVSIFGIIVFLGVAKWQRTYRNDLLLTCLDVGHGQAVLAQLPGNANIMFDAGSLQRSDVGSRIITPFLDYSGISRIDAVVISHNDVDHINGIPEVVEHCKVEHIHANDAFFSGIEQWGTRKFLVDCLAESGLKIERLESNLSFSSSTGIKTLWPKGQITQEQLNDNDKSLVCLIEFAGRRILLCADIGAYAQAEILRQFPNLKADIVVVPHHGSSETLTKGFLQTLQADILICSCDRRHYERQQKIDGEQQAKWYYTPRDGAIMVHVTKKGATEVATYAAQR